MSILCNKDLGSIFFPYCTEEEGRIKAKGIDLAYYCSLDTLFKILNNKEIWLRNIRCMSDRKEVLFGYKTLKEALYEDKDRLNRLIGALSAIDISKRDKWVELFDAAFTDVGNNNLLSQISKYTNIICFTEHDPDNDENGRLDMFNSYGRGNGGCIIIDGPKAVSLNTALSKVIYVKGSNDPSLASVLEQLIRSIEDNMVFLRNVDYTFIDCYVKNAIIYAMASIKHYGFSYEKEWRLILNSQAMYNSKNQSDYIINCVPVCLNGVPQMVFKQSLIGHERLLKKVIIENKFEQMEEKFCLEHLLFTKWKLSKDEASKMIVVSNIPIKR